jgi:hypothetical protein
MSDSYSHAELVLNCTEFITSLLVFPVSIATLVTLGIRCYKEERLLEALPLLATQLNSALIWGCMAAY